MHDNPYREVGWRSEVGGRKWVVVVVGVRLRRRREKAFAKKAA